MLHAHLAPLGSTVISDVEGKLSGGNCLLLVVGGGGVLPKDLLEGGG